MADEDALADAINEQIGEFCEVAAGLSESSEPAALQNLLGQAACLLAIVQAVYLRKKRR